MFDKILSDLWPFILSALTGLGGWIAARPKQKIEVEAGELDNAAKIVEMWQKTAERLENQLEKSDNIILSLKDEVLKLRDEVGQLKQENIELKRLIGQLQPPKTDSGK